MLPRYGFITFITFSRRDHDVIDTDAVDLAIMDGYLVWILFSQRFVEGVMVLLRCILFHWPVGFVRIHDPTAVSHSCKTYDPDMQTEAH